VTNSNFKTHDNNNFCSPDFDSKMIRTFKTQRCQCMCSSRTALLTT